ncbi:MAG: hypothetical protein ACREFP_16615 [Acetobacteraceae bacterium]
MAGNPMNETGGAPDTPERPADHRADDLAVILEQTHESLELLRSLVRLMLPRDGGGEGRQLEEMIAALVAQQRDILLGVRRVEADLTALAGRLDGEMKTQGNGRSHPNGSARP